MFDTGQDGWRPEMALRVGIAGKPMWTPGCAGCEDGCSPGMREMDAATSP
jgi:hypothetical protein